MYSVFNFKARKTALASLSFVKSLIDEGHNVELL